MTEIKTFLQYTILGLEFNCNCEAVSTMSSTCVNESDPIFVHYNFSVNNNRTSRWNNWINRSLRAVLQLGLNVVKPVLTLFSQIESKVKLSNIDMSLLIVRCEKAYLWQNCAFCDQSIPLAGDMSFYMFFQIRVGGTLENSAVPPFWGSKPPLFQFYLNINNSTRPTGNISKHKS